MSTDQYDVRHNELQEEKAKILLKMGKVKKKYLDKYGTENMDLRDEFRLLDELERTKEWKALKKELKPVNNLVIRLYKCYLLDQPNIKLKKEKIIALLEKFGYQISTWHIAEAANCSRGYIDQFDLTIDGKIVQKEYRKKISSRNRKGVLKRDNNSCVMCGSKENLQIHHINPVAHSNLKTNDNIDNLATLCKKCHYLAHDGKYWGIEAYSGVKGGFWEWIKDSERIRMEYMLKDVQGVGPVLINRIYKEFESLENLKNSNLDDLMKIKSINETLAKRIKFRLR